jgi:sulfofructose kinase
LAKILDCLGLGIAPADILMQIEKYPQPGYKIDATDLTVQGGGPIPTAIVTMARSGKRAGLMAPVGEDLFGKFVVEELKKEHVDTSYIIKKQNKRTAIASGWYEKGSGRRTIVLDLSIDIKPADINLKKLPQVKMVHLDGRYLPACIKLARWAKGQKALVVFDIGSIRNDVTKILPLVDHLIISEDFALPYTKKRTIKTAIEKLGKICKGTIVITSGIKGSVGFSDETGFVHQKAFRVKTVDTTGAGDVYHGAYMVGLLDRYDLQKRMKLASAAAAIKCTKPGGRAGIPTYHQVQSFLKKGPRCYD